MPAKAILSSGTEFPKPLKIFFPAQISLDADYSIL